VVSGANGYKVYSYDPGTKAYTEIASTAGTSYTQSVVAPGTTYYYAVCSYQAVGGNPIYSDYSSAASAATPAPPADPVPDPTPAQPTAPGIPSGLKAASASYNRIALTWDAVSGASGYTVYRALSSGGPYTQIAASVTSAGYTNTGLSTGKKYYYKIKAYTLANGTPLYGNETAVVSAKPVPSAPASVKAKRKGTSAALSWKKVSGATKYEVYRATSLKGKYSRIAALKSTSYVNKRLSRKKTYYYKIRAYRLTGKVKVYGSFSATLKVKP
jgi:fibronectin type 3 domain-containing protein